MNNGATAAMKASDELIRLLARLAANEGVIPTAWPELFLIRSHRPVARHQVVYRPCLCIVAQGRKQAFFGDRVVTYDPNNFLVVSLQLPIEAEIVEASVERPFLGLVLEIDAAMVSQLILDIDGMAPVSATNSQIQGAMSTSRADEPFIQSVIRLLRALEDPLDCRILGPAAIREVSYRVLRSSQGDVLRGLALSDSNAYRVFRVQRFLEENYTNHLDITSIARNCNMSESTLHHTFKEATSLSPIQYLKKVRLHQARLMMVNAGLGAGEAGFQVGYESPSQFSREFKRLFGVPPSRASESLPGVTAVSKQENQDENGSHQSHTPQNIRFFQ
ncbi:MAG: AraC family transcriptional regulator [Hyphomicrobiales bacterium]|nr:AraC family transcriptional regulator [Hyphomicrobiales bacterium]